jgi:spore coat polysaccharide biosynthesis predicted glycosyltransferase SpsG
MMRSKLSILSMGRTMYESLFLETPVIAISVSRKHLSFKSEIESTGAVLVAHHSEISYFLENFFGRSDLELTLEKMQLSCKSIFEQPPVSNNFTTFLIDFFEKRERNDTV